MNDAITLLEDVGTLGGAIRAARKKQHVTQAELASLAGVGVRFISDLERGKDTVHFGLALRIARLVGLELFTVARADLPQLQRGALPLRRTTA